jgi:hypothetical protein
MQMEEKDLRWNIEVQSWAIRRTANKIKSASSITAADLVDLAVSCEVLLMELRKHGVEV